MSKNPLLPAQRAAWQLFERSPDGVLVESDGAVAYINDAYAAMLGHRHGRDLSGATVRDIADPTEVDRLTWFGDCRLAGKPAPQHYLFKARRKDRTVISLETTVWIDGAGRSTCIITQVRAATLTRGRLTGLAVPGLKNLSSRESEIFFALLAGQRAKQIAFSLCISEKTVASHRSRIYRKLAVRSDLDLFRFAAHHDLLDARV